MILRIALRQHRGGFIGVTAFGAFAGIAVALGFSSIITGTPAERAMLAAQMELVGRQLSFMLPIPAQLDTMGGFLQWRHFGNLPAVYGAWALLAATGAARGDEDRGLVEQWLAAGLSRPAYLLGRAAAFAIAAAASIALMLAATGLGAAIAEQPVAPGALAVQGAALFALTLCCFGIGLLVAQLAATGRGAAGIGAIVLLGLFLLNGFGRTAEALAAIRQISPFFHYDKTDALLASGGLDEPATLALLAAAAALWLVSLGLFVARDHGAPAMRRRVEARTPRLGPSRDPFLRLPVLAGLDQQRLGLLAWSAGLALFGAFLVTLLPTMLELAADVPLIRVMVLRGAIADLEQAFLGSMWSSAALLLLSIYAITQVASWATEDADGRLEMVLSAPVPRWRVVLERGAVLTLGSAVIVLLSGLVVAAGVRAQGISVDPGDFAVASALYVPFTLAIGALGAALAGWRPRLAVAVLATVVVLSYFIQQLAPLFRFPDEVRDLSLFELYGQPLVSGPNWPGLWTLLALVVLGHALAIVSLQRRDVGR